MIEQYLERVSLGKGFKTLLSLELRFQDKIDSLYGIHYKVHSSTTTSAYDLKY